MLIMRMLRECNNNNQETIITAPILLLKIKISIWGYFVFFSKSQSRVGAILCLTQSSNFAFGSHENIDNKIVGDATGPLENMDVKYLGGPIGRFKKF